MNLPEIHFLEGPSSRWDNLKFVANIAWEFIRGFRALHFSGPCVAVFGSARFTESNPYYGTTRQLSAEIAKLGFTIMTGGGPGLMEAANRGLVMWGPLGGLQYRATHGATAQPLLG